MSADRMIAMGHTAARTPTAATGHRIGRRYYSVRNRICYRVLGVATMWELAPSASVTVRWDNGNTTTTALDRGLDPELCPSCDGHLDGPPWIPVARCTCAASAPAHS